MRWLNDPDDLLSNGAGPRNDAAMANIEPGRPENCGNVESGVGVKISIFSSQYGVNQILRATRKFDMKAIVTVVGRKQAKQNAVSICECTPLFDLRCYLIDLIGSNVKYQRFPDTYEENQQTDRTYEQSAMSDQKRWLWLGSHK